MVIFNNIAAMSALNETNKNLNKATKAARQLSTGEKINSAKDGASEYAISDKMKIRLRALNQDDQNVQKGESLLNVASGAIQSQINLLRTVKERVLNANNDTNTDADRAIIQKEISQCYDEMEDIAVDTEFNRKKILLGNAVTHEISSWVVKDEAVLVEDSSLDLIPDNFDSLDGQKGPFDTFGKAGDTVPYDGYNLKNISPMSLPGADVRQADNKLHDGTPNKANSIDIDLSSYSSVGTSLNNVSFKVNTPSYDRTFVLTTDTSKNYRNGASKINISGCTTAAQVADKIKAALSGDSYVGRTYNVELNGAKLTLTTKATGTGTNYTGSYDANGVSMAGGTVSSGGGTSGTNRTPAPPTGLTLGSFSGGANAVTETTYTEVKNPDDTVTKVPHTVTKVPAKQATATINGISGVTTGSGITVSASGYGRTYLVFKDGSSKPAYDSANGYWTVGKNYSGSESLNGITYNFSSGKLTLTANAAGTGGNSYSITDGVSGSTATTIPVTTVTYQATTALPGSAIKNKQEGANGDTAHWDIDLSAYDVSDKIMAEAFIKEYVGKALSHSNYSGNYEFVDTGTTNAMDSIYKVNNATVIDLNDVRTAVKNGDTIAAAFSNLVKSKIGFSSLIMDTTDTTKVVGVQFNASVPGIDGNKQTISLKEGDLRAYTLDFNSVANAATLDKKGFRFYCATDSSQWVNVAFYNGLNDLDDKPPSGTASQDIDTLVIDVSGINNAKQLVELLDDKLGDYLDNQYKHFFKLASDPDNGKITIYDSRRYTLLNRSDYPNKQEKGAKIADGVLDNVVKDYRYLYANRLIIHHTDESSNNITIDIPQTTMDQIFGYSKKNYDVDHFNILTKDMREKLLGVPPDKGILDNGIEYLTDAQTLIGAQINHLRFADQNIITQNEAVTSAESVIRDTDMAASMMEYTKHNILSQASQSMLAQANQNASNAINLLQG